MKVLVTGSDGFIGKHVIRMLRKRNIQRCGFGRHLQSGLRVYRGDITDLNAVRRAFQKEQPTHCIHLAATGLYAKGSRQRNTKRVNVDGTRNVLEAIRSASPRTKCLLVGSSAEYGLRRATKGITERGRLRPLTLYARTKVDGYRLFRFYQKQHGLRLVYARPFNVTGPGAPAAHLISKIIRAERTRRPLDFFQTSERRDYVDVRDLAEAFWRLLRHGRAGAVYNICSGNGVRKDHLVLQVQRTLHLRNVGGVPRVNAKPLIHQVGDNRKLRSLGWRPRYTLQDSIRDLAATLR